ncbi:MAG: tape measure protein [Alicyclobacillus sp.]|nr:tape measure protein [Alicyclobacillus sp.]
MARYDEVGGLNVQFGLDNTKFLNGISQINRQMKIVEATFNNAILQTEKLGNVQDAAGLKAQQLAQKEALLKKGIEVVSAAYAKYVEQSGELSRSAQSAALNLERLRNRLILNQEAQKKLELGTEQYQAALEKLDRQLQLIDSEYRLASAGAEDFERTQAGMEAKIASLSQTLDVQNQKIAETQAAYDRAVQVMGKDSLEAQDLAIALNKLQAEARATAAQLDAANRALLDGSYRFDELQKSVKRTSSQFVDFASVIKYSVAFGGIYAGLHLIKQGFDAVVTGGIQFDAQMQQAQIGFTTLLGSAQKAKDMLQQLADFAQATPFSLVDVENAAKQLLAMGFSVKQILPTMKAIGDAAAALGLSSDGVQRISLALGQLLTHGKADAQDLLQLTEAGIPAWQILAQAMGKPIPILQQMVTKGLVPADKAVDYLIQGMEQRFPNMLSKMNRSFTSEMGNISDGLNRLFGDLMEPLFNRLTTKILPDAIAKVEQFRHVLDESGSVAAFKTIFPPELVDDVVSLSHATQSFFVFIETHGPLVESILEAIAARFVIFKAGGLVASVASRIGAIGEAIMGLKTAESVTVGIRGLAAAMTGLDAAMIANPIGLVAGALATLGVGIALYIHNQRTANQVSLQAADASEQQYQSNKKLIDEFDKLRSKSLLTTEQFAKYVDLQEKLQNTSDPKKIAEYQKQLGELQKKSGLSNDQLQKMVSLNKKITDTMPQATLEITKQGNRIADTTDKLRHYNQEVAKATIRQLQEQRLKALQQQKDVQAKLNSLEQTYQANLKVEQNLRDQLNGKNQQSIEQRKKELEVDIETHQWDIARVQADKAELQALNQNKQQLEANLLKIMQTNDRTKAQIDNLKKQSNQVQEINKKLVSMYLQEAGISSAVADQSTSRKKAISLINQQIAKQKAHLSELEKVPPQIRRGNAEYAKEVSTIQRQISKLQSIKGEIESITGSARSLNSELSKPIYKSVRLQVINDREAVAGTRFRISAYASGTDYAPGGLAIVGEEGPELVRLPRGAQVIPTRLTEKILHSIRQLPDRTSALLALSQGASTQGVASTNIQALQVITPVYLDGQQIAQHTARYGDKELERLARDQARAQGLVG